MRAYERYRQAISELTLHGGRVAELAEIIDKANDEMIVSMLDGLTTLESRADATNQRLRQLEESVGKVKRGRFKRR